MTAAVKRLVQRSHNAPGLLFAAGIATVGFLVNARWSTISPLTASLVIAVTLGNFWRVPEVCEAGLKFSARRLLRLGVVLLGLQLSLRQIADLGVVGFLLVVAVVVLTFIGTQVIAQVIGVQPDLGLLTATGFSICGVSAVSAMVGATDANEEDATYAIALVTLFGSLSIVVLPVLGHLANMTDVRFGTWAGSAVHDVAQVVATATAFSQSSLAPAMVVKLTRVVLLAPIVSLVAYSRRRSSSPLNQSATTPSPLPAFIVFFLAMVIVRSTGWLPTEFLSAVKHVERVLLAMALVGLGVGVRFRQMRILGIRPILLGVSSWVLVMSVSFATSRWIHLAS